MNSHITKRTTAIHDTVKEAQELLANVGRGEGSRAKWVIEIITLFECPLVFPQSLGELCIGLAQDSVRYWGEGTEKGTMGRNFAERLRRNIQDLRQLLYHKTA
jgi:hypothetical protein